MIIYSVTLLRGVCRILEGPYHLPVVADLWQRTKRIGNLHRDRARLRMVCSLAIFVTSHWSLLVLADSGEAKAQLEEWHFQAVLEALRDPVDETRSAALRFLADSGPDYLGGASKHRADIADVLGKEILRLANQRKLPELQAAIGALGKMGAEGAKHVATLLRSGNVEIQQAAIEALGQMGAEGAKHAEAVAKFLTNEDPRIQRAAIEALGQMRTEGAKHAEAVAKFLGNEDPRIQRAAIEALEQMGAEGVEHAEAVAKLLRNGDLDLAAILTLGRTGAKSAKHAEAVAKLLSNGEPVIQGGAIEALGQMGAEGAKHAEAVAKFLSNEDPRIQRAAIEALGQMEAEGAKHAEAVAKFLSNEDLDIQRAAIKALGQTGAEGAKHAEAVAKFLSNEDPRIQRAAIEALGQMEAEGAKHAEAVAKFLSNGEPYTQEAAILALGQMGAEGAKHAEAVAKFLTNRDSDTLQAAIKALGQMGVSTTEVVAKLLSSGEPYIQQAAILALRQMGAEGAKHAEAVLTLLNSDDRETRNEAQSALRRWAMTEVLTGPRLLPLCLEGVLSNRDEAAEFRLTCHLLGLSVPPDGRLLMQWIGDRATGEFRSPQELGRDEAGKVIGSLLKLWPTIDAREENQRPLTPALRREVAAQIREIAVAGDGRFELGDLPLLERAIFLLSSAGFSGDAAALREVRDRVKWWDRIRTGTLFLTAHASLWALLLFGYRRFPLIQGLFFWNPWARRFVGLGYVGVLITVIPYLRQLMFFPFRESLVQRSAFAQFPANAYFPDSEVVELGAHRTEQRRPLSSICASFGGQIVLEGDSGLGKTTFLLKLVTTSKRITALLKATECEKGVVAAIQSRLHGQVRDESYLRSLIHAGAIDVFIDGLNEATPEVRARIVNFVEESFRGTFVLTTQLMDWDPPRTARILRLQPLRGDQVVEFMRRQWHAEKFPSTFTEAEYSLKVRAHVQDLEGDDARLTVLSNPMEATIAAELIAKGEHPDELRLVAQRFAALDRDFSQQHGRVFPRRRFAEHVYHWRKSGTPYLDPTGFDAEIAALVDHKLMIERTMEVKGRDEVKTERRWWFRHDKFMDYCLLPAFVDDAGRRREHAADEVFFGVYDLLALSLTDEEDLELHRYLVEAAADTKKYELLNRYTRARRRRRPNESRESVAPDGAAIA